MSGHGICVAFPARIYSNQPVAHFVADNMYTKAPIAPATFRRSARGPPPTAYYVKGFVIQWVV